MSIDDIFKPTSCDVAQALIGMQIQRLGDSNIYTVTNTKAYLGPSKQTASKPLLRYGGILMFNMRGFPHFCVTTGTEAQWDYVLINGLANHQTRLTSAGAVSNQLGLDFEYEGRRFADNFQLQGQTQSSQFIRDNVATCLGGYSLLR